VITVAALRFLYTVTLQKPWSVVAVIPAPKMPQTLPVVLSPAEVVLFLDSVKTPKVRVILTTCYAAGLRMSEAVHLTIPAIASQRMVLRIEQGKGQKDRYVMLSPKLLEILREWWRVRRPRHWLFPSHRPECPITSRAVDRAPAGTPAQRHSQTHHAAFAASRVCRPSPGSGHRRPHDPIAARPSESRDDGPLSRDRHDAGVRDRESSRFTPAPRRGDSPPTTDPLICDVCESGHPDGGGRFQSNRRIGITFQVLGAGSAC
jgi:hypothetical protein